MVDAFRPFWCVVLCLAICDIIKESTIKPLRRILMTINYRQYRDSSSELADYVTALENEIQKHLGELHFLAFFEAFQDDKSRRVNQ